VNDQVISDLTIELKLTDLNYATFLFPEHITLGTYVTIKYAMHTPVFIGKVVQSRKMNRTIDGKTQYAIEIHEPAEELYNKYITSAEYTGIYLKNTDKTQKKTLGWYVSKIISGLGVTEEWKDVSDTVYKNVTSPPGTIEDDSDPAIPSMGFSVCTVMTALNRLIVNIFNYGLWFDYFDGNGATVRRIRYGPYRSDVYPKTVPVNIAMLENSVRHNIDGIIVYGDSNSLYATAGSISRTSSVMAYRYNGCQSKKELQWVAQRVYEQRSEASIRFEVTFPAEYFSIHEGDRLHIYDTSVGLAATADGYGVKDVKITAEYIQVGLGAANMTIFDILNDRLSVIDGSILSFEPLTIETQWHNVFASSDVGMWGATTSIPVTIAGSTFMGEYYLTPVCGGEQIEGAGFTRIFASIGNDETEKTITATSDMVISASAVFASSEWFPWSIKWAEVTVSYVFDPDLTEEDAMVDWTMTWGNTENPNLYTEENFGLIAFSGEQPSSFNYSTITHGWYVHEKLNMPQSWPTIVASCHDGTDTVTIKDICVKIVIFWEASSTYPPVETTMASGEIQMRAVYPTEGTPEQINYTDWITIYDTASRDIYIGKSYDMEQYIMYSRFGTGDHTIEVQCMGTGNCSVKLFGTYAAFNEKTRVINT
jgi:hypothetical protein